MGSFLKRRISGCMRRVVIVVGVVACLISGKAAARPSSPTSPQTMPDYGVPDSIYIGIPEYSPNQCSNIVTASIPVYLWSDGISAINAFGFFWLGDIDCDTAIIYNTGNPGIEIRTVYKDTTNHQIAGSLGTQGGSVCPTNGTEHFLDLVFAVSLGDTFSIRPDSMAIFFHNFFDLWRPLYQSLYRTFVVPDTLIVAPGDPNSSGSVSIADAVFLINYIFSGGCAPYDHNAADPDASCSISIADAVYLINYIFAGGSTPQAGCVVP